MKSQKKRIQIIFSGPRSAPQDEDKQAAEVLAVGSEKSKTATPRYRGFLLGITVKDLVLVILSFIAGLFGAAPAARLAAGNQTVSIGFGLEPTPAPHCVMAHVGILLPEHTLTMLLLDIRMPAPIASDTVISGEDPSRPNSTKTGLHVTAPRVGIRHPAISIPHQSSPRLLESKLAFYLIKER